MKKQIKKIFCIAICLILCIGALTSCGRSGFAYTESELTKFYNDHGYDSQRMSGDAFEGVEIYEGSNTYFSNIDLAIYVYDDDFKEHGFFFYCLSENGAKKNEENLRDYLRFNDQFDLVRRVDDVVYIGTSDIWYTIEPTAYSASSGIAISEAMLEKLLLTLMGIAFTVVVLIIIATVIIYTLIHHTVILILIIVVLVHSITNLVIKKKIKRLKAAYEALAQEVASAKEIPPEE